MSFLGKLFRGERADEDVELTPVNYRDAQSDVRATVAQHNRECPDQRLPSPLEPGAWWNRGGGDRDGSAETRSDWG